MANLTFEIEKDGNQYHSWCPELPGCHSHGSTTTQAIEHLKDAVSLYLSVLIEDELTHKALSLDEG
ncbi:MAG: type II toxin-antitoxin system HicB family antitoxin [Cyclobacteriaceae bacterium]